MIQNGSSLDSIDLNNLLSGADFNDIYKEISRQAPPYRMDFKKKE